jgi:hypothetical protein
MFKTREVCGVFAWREREGDGGRRFGVEIEKFDEGDFAWRERH